jgi:DNA-binding NtrC family response regulator
LGTSARFSNLPPKLPIRINGDMGLLPKFSDTTILVVEDEDDVREFCVDALTDAGFTVESAGSGEAALAALERGHMDIVLSDLKMAGLDGLALLKLVKENYGSVDVVMMTGHATVTTAVEAMRLGAYDYLTKPLELDGLTSLLERLVERRELILENRLLKTQANTRSGPGGMIGESPQMQELYRLVLKAAGKRHPVLILGESGTGKELVARAIHEQAPWKAEPFVPVDCSALAENLIESELFGHVRGAFTGASQDRIGLLSSAGSGSVFLDEIGELSVGLQAKLLRALQEREFRPVGSNQRKELKARVLAATNRDIQAAVKDGTFRGDLYYRLNVLTLKVSPLRNRQPDIPLLAEFFLVRHKEPQDLVQGISPEAMDRLTAYPWPGNVRELENCMRRALAVSCGPLIEVADLPAELRCAQPAFEPADHSRLEEMERKAIVDSLEATGGHRLRAAKLLGMGKTTMYRKLKEYGLENIR